MLERRHRAHARVEDRIRGAKDSGLRNLPCDTFTQALTLDGELRRAEPAGLRYKLLHAPARLVRPGRRWTLRIQRDWPWAADLLAASSRMRNLPRPAT